MTHVQLKAGSLYTSGRTLGMTDLYSNVVCLPYAYYKEIGGPVHTRQNKGHVRLSPMKKGMKILFRTGFPKASREQLSGLEMTFTPPRESGKQARQR